MTEDDVLELLHQAIKRAGSARAFARQNGLTASYVSDVVHRRRALASKILKALGVKRYRQIIDVYVTEM